MNKTTSGWTIFVISLGMMAGLISNDVAKLTQWGQALQPGFVALLFAHFGTIVTAFIGGKMIPETRESQFTRAGDK